MRCAIYTRKSSDEGLEQPFNSLQAQREACEAYVRSQTGEGWWLVPTLYDDGGWSGGSMDRPALQQLLRDISAGGIDTVVVYKVDRLTRSLADFAKIVDIFDAQGSSFVSVTQPFNTTTSMGRLTLNVLLSFAQFEREVTGERIRDKIAASKAKGMWMGGNLPLGYDAPDDPATRALRVNLTEAETVRLIYAQYLRLRSVHKLQRWLEQRDIRSKCWVSTRGRTIGGAVFSRGALFHLLRSRVYLGSISHKSAEYPNAHPAILDEATFNAVQQSLSGARHQRAERPKRADSMLLKGLIFDADGHRMSPVIGQRAKRVYRYYVSAPLQQGQTLDNVEAIRRLPATDVDNLVLRLVGRLKGVPEDELGGSELRRAVSRVEIHAHSVQVVLAGSSLFARRSDPHQELLVIERRLGSDATVALDVHDPANLRVTLATRLRLRGGRTWIVAPDGRPHVRAAAPRPDPILVRALRSAHVMLSARGGTPIGAVEGALLEDAPANIYQRRLIRLAFLAPQIQRDILEGRQAPGLTLEQLMHTEISPNWRRQTEQLG